jgi:hypothetical protein
MENDDLASDLLDGVPAIAEFLGLTERQVYHLADPRLGSRRLPLFKVGERKWFARKSSLRRYFESLEGGRVA